MLTENKLLLLASQVIIWCVFSIVYTLLEYTSPGVHFGDDFNAPYFSTITQLTIGFGDIAPKTTTARLLVSAHAILSSFSAILLL
jgi:uncharacterized membrane protein